MSPKARKIALPCQNKSHLNISTTTGGLILTTEDLSVSEMETLVKN
jgi:hypothetical protein